MSTELGCLFASVILGLTHLFAAAHAATGQRGVRWNMSSREAPTSALTGWAGRLDRAHRNFLETFGYFVAAVLIAHVTQRESRFSELGAELYLAARILYLPTYAIGIVGLRSLIWLASIAGLLSILYSIIA